ncbi:MAG: Type 1 glutamine amidotransferase-like domain-containing protein [Candidatus Nanoarchaeia archaeon]|nr:Type 1 glutamine amidotransferase-like domain-containing protein [Candidatus Nanoarchaeia archaeon]
MSGKIFLAGGGSPEESVEIDKSFKECLVNNPKVIFISLARSPEKREKSIKWFKEIYSFTEVLHLESSEQLNKKELINFDCIYICGGNTFRLLDNLSRSGILKILKDFNKLGKPIYGGSAGAIILGKRIDTAKHLDENVIGRLDFNGLDFLNGFSIVCHYKEQDKEIIKNYAKTRILCLPEDAGIIVEGNYVKVLGNNCLFMLNEEEKILEVDKTYNLKEL